MNSLPPIPPSPGVGARRKGPKSLPRLPASAFSPPNTGTSDKFPLAPSPSVVHPEEIIDAHATEEGEAGRWVEEGKAAGVVLSLAGKSEDEVASVIANVHKHPTTPPTLALLVPFNLDAGTPASPPAYLSSLSSASQPQIVLHTIYTRYSTSAVDALRWALEHDFTVDLGIETNLRAGEGAWEDLEELLTKAIPERKGKGKIVLSNILPPPDDLSLPIVKLLTHPIYHDYQSQTAALSLYANVFIKFLPPVWGAAEVDRKEWKRRIKMYVGPALEAFGYERIIFGSSSTQHPAPLNPREWYELARESFAELGTEQEDLDAVFAGNAKSVYGTEGRKRHVE